MSVSVEPPRHFNTQTNSPSFSSPPQSPVRLIHAPTPPPTTPRLLASVPTAAMSTTVATQPPVGQRHDREDAEMQDDDEGMANISQPQNGTGAPDIPQEAPSAADLETGVTDEDVMDTTPDPEAHSTLPDSTIAPDAILDDSTAQSEAAPATVHAANESDPPIEQIADTVSSSPGTNGYGTDRIQAPQETQPPDGPAVGSDNPLQPPPPPPPVRSLDDSESDEDDDGLHPWHPLNEDTSSPDEEELKEIIASTEHSALDHKYWESQTFLPLEEPEYSAGVSGRIEWTIDAYNGTREKPNRDIVMRSEPVNIGGYQWQIKFFPRGNDSDYLSVYLECLSMTEPKDSEVGERASQSPSISDAARVPGKDDAAVIQTDGDVDALMTEDPTDAEAACCISKSDAQHTPLPLLGDRLVPKRNCVAAQVSVVLYNPAEPRVNYSKTALHRFCGGSPDWGWTRFHGPHYDIAHRMRGQRQALLRNDKLAFTGYVRIIDDETGCLGEHHSRENPWDSFAMTGLQGLVLGENASAPGGNMISALAMWIHFKPFRELLYTIRLPNPAEDPFVHPKPLLSALQKVLYMLRTQVDPGSGPVSLDDVSEALEWYSSHHGLHKFDVVQLWDVLRAKLDEELEDTPHAATMQTLFGLSRDHTVDVPRYRIPVVDIESVQAGIDQTTDFASSGGPLPQMLMIELDRQVFDIKTRSYLKLVNKVTLNDDIKVGDVSYTLFGFVVHKQTLQSCVYQPIVRPGGRGTKWYSYSDSKDENHVNCLAKRQAVDAHEGRSGAGQITGNDAVAYVAVYTCNDTIPGAPTMTDNLEHWDVPSWLMEEIDRDSSSRDLKVTSSPSDQQVLTEAEPNSRAGAKMDGPQVIDVKVISSKVYQDYEGRGFFDAFQPRWQNEQSEFAQTVQLLSTDKCSQVREKIAAKLDNIQDARQIKFWFLDPVAGFHGRPKLVTTGKIDFSCGEFNRYAEEDWTLRSLHESCRAIWVHVVDINQLPEIPTEAVKQLIEIEQVPSENPEAENIHEGPLSHDSITTQLEPQSDPALVDTPMSEPDETPVEMAVSGSVPSANHLRESTVGSIADSADTTMSEMRQATVIEIIPVRPTEHNPDAQNHTNMADVQAELPPPPPPPVGLASAMPAQPSSPRSLTPEPLTEEIYFFLKYWDPSTQVLCARGSHVVPRTDRVDDTIVKLLELPSNDKKKLDIWEEDEFTGVHAVKHRRTFAQLNIKNTAILVASYPLTAEQRSALADRAAFFDLKDYLGFCADARNYKHKLNGHFTFNYFSSEYYKGEVKNFVRHGHGKHIYESGATYEGTFRLGQRHGHGLYTFQNGDTYDGDWVDDQQHGTGTFVEATTGNTYTGGWKNDKKFGEGVTHWKDAQEAERLCRICWDEPADAAFYDCGHVVACLTCAREVQTCPVCRKRVLCAMKLYYVS